MKLEIEVPEWAIGKHIYIFAGNELLAKKEVRIVHENGTHVAKYLPLELKPEDGRCTGCSNCCKDGGIGVRMVEHITKLIIHKQKFNKESSDCAFLGGDGCKLGSYIPFSCIRSVCTEWEGCTERLEVVK